MVPSGAGFLQSWALFLPLAKVHQEAGQGEDSSKNRDHVGHQPCGFRKVLRQDEGDDEQHEECGRHDGGPFPGSLVFIDLSFVIVEGFDRLKVSPRPDPANRREHQRQNQDCGHHQDSGANGPLRELVEVVGEVVVAFQRKTEHEADQEWRPRKVERLHQPADDAEHEHERDDLELLGTLEPGDEQDRDQAGCQEGERDERQLGQRLGDDETDQGAEHARNGERPDDHVDHIEVIGDDSGAGLDPEHQKRTQQQGGGSAPGNSEQEGRDQVAGLDRVGGGLRGDDASRIAFAEFALALTLCCGLCLAVGHPGSCRRTDAGQDTGPDSDQRTTEHVGPVVEELPNALAPTGAQGVDGCDGSLARHEGDDLGDAEDSQGDRHQVDAV